MDAVSELFWDEGKRAFYDTPTDHEELVTRPRDVYDNAAPSGTSVATEVLLKLALLLDRGDYRQRAEDVLEELAGGMEKVPAGFGRLLCALDFSTSEPREVAIVGDPEGAGYKGPVGEGLLQLSAEQGRGGTRPRRRRGGRFDPTPRPAPGSRRQGHGLRLRAIRLPDPDHGPGGTSTTARRFGTAGRAGVLVTPALRVGYYLNVKLATPLVPSLNFTTSWRLVPAQFLLVFHT